MEEQKNSLNKKEKRTLMIVSLALVLALVLGISYAYFLAQGQSAQQTVTTRYIALDFDDDTDIINEDNIEPLVREVALPVQDESGAVTTEGKAVTKEFTVTNKGNEKMFVHITLEDMVLPPALKRYDFMWSLYEVTDTTNNIEKNVSNGSFDTSEGTTVEIAPYQVFEAPVLIDEESETYEYDEKTYKLYIWIEETYLNQNSMMNQTFKATVVATGEVYHTSPESDFTVDENGVITAYTGPGGDIIIPEKIGTTTVTSIGDSVFIDTESGEGKNITSVVIPNIVTSIGNNAFHSNQLTSVFIPNSVTSIGGSVFTSNQNLKTVSIPNSVTSIGSTPFEETNLTSVVIPNTITTLDNTFAFSNLKNVIIPNSVTSIDGAFYNCDLTSVVIPSNVKTTSNAAFGGNERLSSVIIQEGLEVIGSMSFNMNESLKTITIPSSVTTIESEAFSGNSLTEIIIVGKNSIEEFTGGYEGLVSSEYNDMSNVKITFK